MIETIATLITVFCGIFSMIITACTIQAPYSKTVANVLKTLLIISIINSKIINNSLTTNAQMAKLVDASDLNSDDYYNRAGSIPALSTFINLKKQ